MKQTSLKWIYNYTKKYLWAVVLLAIISGAIALSFILLALVSSSLLDMATGVKKGNIITQCFFLTGLILLQAILNILSSNVRVRVSGKIEMKMKEILFSSLLKKQYLQITKIHSGEILNRFTSDVQVVVNGVISIIPQTISLGTKLIAGLFVLIRINLMFTVIIMTLGIVMYFSSRLYSSKFKYLHKLCQETDGKTRSFIQECLENIVVIKSFSNGLPIMKKLSQYQTLNYKAKVKRNAVSNIANTFAYVMLTSGYFLTLAWGSLQISSKVMTFGTLTAFLQIIEQMKAPFRNMSGLTPQYYSMLASAERLQEMEELEDEFVLEPTPKIPEDISFDAQEIYKALSYIKLENISFRYDHKKILDHANLVINKGDLIAIAGTSGAGKSTLIKLLLGLINPDSGEIYIQTTEDPLRVDAETRKLFSYVPQTNMILSGTIRENISFFNSAVSEIQIIKALKTACIWNYIEKLPAKLDTILGERGTGLSEGQIQRLAIARAVVSDAPVLLLDECTSALDEWTEKEVLKNIKALTTKTIVYISHKAGTINSCDRIIYIENGKVLEDLING